MKITEGLSNYYLVHALASLVLALFSFFYSNLWATIFVAIALVFLFVISGVEIDTSKRTYRKYDTFIGFITVGKWSHFSKTDHFHLMLSAENTNISTPILFAPTHFYNGRKSKLITFDIVLINDDGRKTVKDFTKYNSAKFALKRFQIAGCKVRNRIAEKIIENKKRR